MGLKERVNKLCNRLPPQGAELDHLIELEIERIGEDAARVIIEEFLQELKLDESEKQS